jgi:hypothetical protein
VNTLYCVEEWRGEQRISPPQEITSTPGDKFHPYWTTPLGSKFPPSGEVKNGPQKREIIETEMLF